jgi:hypothetical protein
MSEKIILDATAGFRKMHYNPNNPRVLYIDEREEVKPDIVADFRDLKQFPNKRFKMVVFDPPHLIDKWQPDNSKNNPFVAKYGLLKAETWASDIRRGILECYRVLDDYGTLLFKWSSHDKTLDEVFSALPFEPILAEETKSNGWSKHPNNKNSRFGANKTLWFVFLKIPEVASNANQKSSENP